MTYRFKFYDTYNGDHVLIGCGDTEQAAVRDAIQKGRLGYPFRIGGTAYLSHPNRHEIEEVNWHEGAGPRGAWRIWMNSGQGDNCVNISFTLWATRGEPIPAEGGNN